MLKVLIADDERIVRKTLRLIGNWDEYEMEIVGEAQNGMEALEMIDQLKPDILLLDMKMPGLSKAFLLFFPHRIGFIHFIPVFIVL